MIWHVTVEKGGIDTVADSAKGDQGAGTAKNALSAALGEDSAEFVKYLSHDVRLCGGGRRKTNGDASACWPFLSVAGNTPQKKRQSHFSPTFGNFDKQHKPPNLSSSRALGQKLPSPPLSYTLRPAPSVSFSTTHTHLPAQP